MRVVPASRGLELDPLECCVPREEDSARGAATPTSTPTLGGRLAHWEVKSWSLDDVKLALVSHQSASPVMATISPGEAVPILVGVAEHRVCTAMEGIASSEDTGSDYGSLLLQAGLFALHGLEDLKQKPGVGHQQECLYALVLLGYAGIYGPIVESVSVRSALASVPLGWTWYHLKVLVLLGYWEHFFDDSEAIDGPAFVSLEI